MDLLLEVEKGDTVWLKVSLRRELLPTLLYTSSVVENCGTHLPHFVACSSNLNEAHTGESSLWHASPRWFTYLKDQDTAACETVGLFCPSPLFHCRRPAHFLFNCSLPKDWGIHNLCKTSSQLVLSDMAF